MKGTFRSLSTSNYRLWAAGALVSNIGTWMQRTAQDWIVLTELTHNNATAVGIVMGLQFGPHILLLPVTGFVADHVNRRKLLFATQGAMGLLALGLGVLTITGLVQLWHVYVFAFLLGCVTAFDAPARQTFIGELVEDTHLSNAVALNSSSFNGARMIGPAVAGILIGLWGSGWVFVLNAVSFAAVISSLAFLRVDLLRPRERSVRKLSGLTDGFRYVSKRPDLMTILVMLALIGTFGINFPIFISTMAVTVFHAGASQFGLLTSMMAIGSVTGALLTASRSERARMTFFAVAALAFGAALAFAASMPHYWFFGFALILVGCAAQSFTTTAISAIQLWTDSTMRGRVMAIFLAITLGGTPLGAPLIGHIADTFGPRAAIGVGAASGFMAAVVALYYLMKYRHMRFCIVAGRLRITSTPEDHAA